jgi:hypothetical protein
MSKQLIYFAAVSPNKDILYIVTLDSFKIDTQRQFKVRYYVIRTFGLYNYKFYMDIRLNIFKESIVLASSYCNQTECEYSESNNNIHHSSLIFFSYPNSQDRNENIVDEFFEQNALLLNLTKYVTIDNNIFGLIYSKIIIENIDNCNTIKLISSTKDMELESHYELSNDEYINISFNTFDYFNCTIKYFYEVTEPDYQTYESYPEIVDTTYGNYSEEYYNINRTKKYPGKISYYNLYLIDQLKDECNENCILCYDNSEKECIVCKYNYSIETDINGKKQKACLNQTKIPTENPTEKPTEKNE